MAEEQGVGLALITGGALGGLGVAEGVGSIGLAVGGTAVGLGAMPLVGVGAIAGAAVYGAYRGVAEADPWALGAGGAGAIAGFGVSSSVGGVGLLGGFGGLGLGLGAMTAIGGITGLGVYGMAKLLDSGPRESGFQAFGRMEERLNEELAYQFAYTNALIELMLPEEDILRRLMAYDVEPEIQRLSRELQAVDSEAWAKAQGMEQSLRAGGYEGPPIWYSVMGLPHHTAQINAIAFYPDQPYLFSASDDATVSCLDLRTGKRRSCIHLPGPVLSFTLDAKIQTLLSGGIGSCLTQWSLDPPSPQMIDNMSPGPLAPGTARFTRAIAASPQGDLWASGGSDRIITLWCRHELHRRKYRMKRQLRGHTDTICSIAIAHDGQTLASGSADQTIRLWPLTSWEPPRILQGDHGAVYSVALCPSRPLLVSAGQDGHLRFWDLVTGALIETVAAHPQPIHHLAFSPDGAWLASSGNDGLTKLWQLTDYAMDPEVASADPSQDCRPISIERKATLLGGGAIAFDGTGKIFASSQANGQIQIWQCLDARLNPCLNPLAEPTL